MYVNRALAWFVVVNLSKYIVQTNKRRESNYVIYRSVTLHVRRISRRGSLEARSFLGSQLRTRHPPRLLWPIWSHTVTFFMPYAPLPRKATPSGREYKTVPRDKVSTARTMRWTVDFWAVGFFDVTTPEGDAIVWSLARMRTTADGRFADDNVNDRNDR